MNKYNNSTLYFMIILYWRTTKKANWPNISYIQRKPKPLGAEYKNFLSAEIKVMAWMEIQEGKDVMRHKMFAQSLGVTAACVKRAVVAGKNFETIKPKEISTDSGCVDMDLSEDSLDSSQIEHESSQTILRDEEEKNIWDYDDIEEAVLALRKLLRGEKKTIEERCFSEISTTNEVALVENSSEDPEQDVRDKTVFFIVILCPH